MRHPGRNANHVSRGKLAPDAGFDCAIALFVGGYRLSIHQLATQYQGGRSRLHEEDVNLVFMPLRRAVGFAPD